MLSRKIALVFFITFSGLRSFSQLPPLPQYSVQQLRSDLFYYRQKLEQRHPGLYRYNTKQDVADFFDSLTALIREPMNAEQFYGLISLTSALVKDGHTILLPAASLIDRYNTHCRFLPFQPGLAGDTLYVRQVWTAAAPFQAGAIIQSINGIPAAELVQQLRLRQLRDGLQTAYADWILDQYFKEYYGFIFGHPDEYTLKYVNEKEEGTTVLQGLLKDSISNYRKRYMPAIPVQKGVELFWIDTIPILKIRSFDDDLLKNQYAQSFSKEIKAAFSRLRTAGARHLIIDLRDNQGGDIENGVLLLSYLLTEPFQVVEQYRCVKGGVLVTCGGPQQGWHKPNQEAYKGKLYVLVNGGSFSNAVIVASALRAQQRAVFLGTMTGGNPVVLSGNEKHFQLPVTKIEVDVPVLEYGVRILSEKNEGTGLQPDYRLIQSINSVLNGKDEVMQHAIQIIRLNQ